MFILYFFFLSPWFVYFVFKMKRGNVIFFFEVVCLGCLSRFFIAQDPAHWAQY
ncbi:hypothetical protein B0T17DRAFT_515358 [Bombardia bombarda]|uniref:Uncharacterized protein n=1 Tax=Bombardia bombarda TaxID=252184 RepID=A0AA40CF46_9PEZI|nr:hypothetical protein B0T17DRAFT_515358 [Bombardia bombarda]